MKRTRTIRIQLNYEPLPLQGYKDRLASYEKYIKTISEDDDNPLTVPTLLGLVEDMIERQKQLLQLVEMVESERDHVVAEIRPTKSWEKMAYATAYGYEIAEWQWCSSPSQARHFAHATSSNIIEGEGHIVAVVENKAHIFQFSMFPPRDGGYIW